MRVGAAMVRPAVEEDISRENVIRDIATSAFDACVAIGFCREKAIMTSGGELSHPVADVRFGDLSYEELEAGGSAEGGALTLVKACEVCHDCIASVFSTILFILFFSLSCSSCEPLSPRNVAWECTSYAARFRDENCS